MKNIGFRKYHRPPVSLYYPNLVVSDAFLYVSSNVYSTQPQKKPDGTIAH